MKKLIILIVLLTLVFFGFWASVLNNSRKHLEFDHPSESLLQTQTL